MKKCLIVVALVLLPAAAAAQASLVQSQKERLGLTTHLSRTQLHELAKAVAAAAGGQLLVPTGDHCNGFSCDKICLAGRVIDYLGDSEASATPAWSDIGPVTAPLRCENVPGGTTPPPPPPPPDLAVLIAKLDRIESKLQELEMWLGGIHKDTWSAAAGVEQLQGQLKANTDALGTVWQTLERMPFIQPPVYTGRVLGQTITLRPQPQK